MNSFMRTGNTKKSLQLGVYYLLSKIEEVELTRYKRGGSLIGTKFIDIKEFKSKNPFREIFLMASQLLNHDGDQTASKIAIGFNNDSGRPCLTKEDIQKAKYFMGFDPETFESDNPKIYLSHLPIFKFKDTYIL